MSRLDRTSTGRASTSKIVLVLAATSAMATGAFGQESVEPPAEGSMISLIGLQPAIQYSFRRYPTFYGDPNTVAGDLGDRTQLSGNWGGLRDQAVDHGIYFDVGVTQFLQGVVDGGKHDDTGRYNGTADYWLTIDTGKAGLWPGAALFVHAESSWQASRSINDDTGSLVPANFDATMPTQGDSDAFALPEVYLAQGLPGNLLLMVGKVDFAGIGDQSTFANNERTQFLYTGLVNNPILGSFLPYTPLGIALDWAPSKEHNLAVLAVQSNGNASTSGFDEFNGEMAYGTQYQYSPTIADRLPGNYRVLLAYSTKEFTNFDIDLRTLIGEVIGLVPIDKKDGNYTALLNFDQYLWTRDAGAAPADAPSRKGLAPVGVGVFFRAGWQPEDRNVIDQFYSLGVGGYGGFPGRDRDQWGVGWSGTHISSDVRRDLSLLGREANTFEHGFEAFYNYALTPAAHVSLNLQFIDSASAAIDTATVIGTRLQLDF
jgi:carbohydrate-selective porin OprB